MIFLNISNGSEIPLMSIMKLFVDTFVSLLRREVDLIIISFLPITRRRNFRLLQIEKKKKKKCRQHFKVHLRLKKK